MNRPPDTTDTQTLDKAFFQSVIDGVSESILVIDREYRVLYANRTARRVYFADQDLSGNPLCHLAIYGSDHPCAESDRPCPLKQVVHTGQTMLKNFTRKRKDGTSYILELAITPVFDDRGQVAGVIEVGRNITERVVVEEERRKLQKQMLDQQREQSIAKLAGGIAHEFNNTLTAILGNVDLLRTRLPVGSKEVEYARNIFSSGERLAHLTRQLLAYAKGGKFRPERLDMNPLLAVALELARSGTKSGIEIRYDLARDLWPLHADRSQIEQLLINIATNAFEAMAGSGGTLYVKTSNMEAHEAWQCSFHHHHSAGDYVHIQVTDTGPGIKADILDRIFEPFFTTNFIGRGLGLSAALGIAQNHGGCIAVESVPGEGATFHILFPRAR